MSNPDTIDFEGQDFDMVCLGDGSTEFDPCYQPARGMPGDPDYREGFIHTVNTLLQVRKFWYNVLTWVAPACSFEIDDGYVVPN